MNTKLRRLAIVLIIFLLALLPILHVHLFSFGLDYDIFSGQHAVGLLTFALVLLLKIPKSKLMLLNYIVFVPLLCTILFSWAELLSEIDPHNISKGWGILWFICCYVSSFTGFLTALIGKWLVLKWRSRAPFNT